MAILLSSDVGFIIDAVPPKCMFALNSPATASL